MDVYERSSEEVDRRFDLSCAELGKIDERFYIYICVCLYSYIHKNTIEIQLFCSIIELKCISFIKVN